MSTERRNLDGLVKPRSLVVIGASNDATRIGGRPLYLAREFGFEGNVCGVNPKYAEVLGFPCYPALASVPYTPELAIVALAAKDVLGALSSCVDKGVKAAVVFAGGFAETGTVEGRRLQEDIAELCRKTGLLVAGPNGIGLINVANKSYATFMSAVLDARPVLGGVAVVAQSGGACIAVHNSLHARSVGENYILNTGNEACVGFSEYVGYVAADPSTKVVAGYIEGLDGSDGFVEKMIELRERNLPTVLYKVGETPAGAEAAASHTARMAGSHGVFKAALRQLGAMRADDMEQLAELAYLAQFSHRTAGLKVGILTTSGAFAAILTDKFVGAGLSVPRLSDAAQAALRPHLPAIATVVNPVDITANVVNSPDGFEDALATMLRTDELDVVVFFSTANLIDGLTPQMVRAAGASSKLLCVLVTGQTRRVGDLEAAGIPVFRDTGRGASAVASMAHWNVQKETWKHWPRPVSPQPARRMSVAGVLDQARAGGRTSLDEKEGKEILARYGIPVPAEAAATHPDEAEQLAEDIGYPVVLKVLSPDIVHKSDVGGVKLSLANRAEVRQAYAQIMASVSARLPSADIQGVLVQQQAARGVELLVSCTVDPLFGPVLTVAAGGLQAELIADVAQRLLPISKEEAGELLAELKSYPLLTGYRGAPAANLDAVAELLASMSEMAVELKDDISEIEVNPVIVQPGAAMGGVLAVDCVVRLS
ncbi:acetate--CoA ligase family protein [Verticiella sediminum]|uniref:Acetate--CoA ligase family protein n=1 Tax=Verticiella sediminum TaxID=1247510 RepID=A0A556AGM9_9BURK|nr:acetate--CoA ligase family protein [Verticiella sediminum]TSH92050.1 acetate--CoA ligase family protein [Verticiella sediminum]